jgi:predicted DNA-binding WGR domain protein
MAYLTRTDPTRNINRFYVVDISPTLFGDWALLREWDTAPAIRAKMPAR